MPPNNPLPSPAACAEKKCGQPRMGPGRLCSHHWGMSVTEYDMAMMENLIYAHPGGVQCRNCREKLSADPLGWECWNKDCSLYGEMQDAPPPDKR